MKLSESELNILAHGARDARGVISEPMKRSNFDKPEKRMAKLTAMGLVTPNAHGDWYITDAGRSVVTAEKTRAR